MSIPGANVVALLLADARLPTGGHTQSAGLEAAVRAGLGDDGRRLDDVASYAAGRLRTVVRVEAGTAVLARHLAVSGLDPRDVEQHWAARTPSPALRAASRRQGRALLRMAGRVWPSVLHHLPPDAEIPRSVVLGVVSALTGVNAEHTARLAAYEDVQTIAAAALKLLPVDPVENVRWVVALQPEIDEVVARTAGLTRLEDLPADGAPLVDAYAQQHTTERMRLFHA